MTTLINPQIRLLAAASLLLITLLCCPDLPEPGTPTPTPTPTPIPILALGEWVTWGDLSVSVESYEVVDRCPGEGPGPAEGAKLLYVWIAMRNHGDKGVGCPACEVTITYENQSTNVYEGIVCWSGDPSLRNACSARMYPGVECRGRELFEVPVALQVEGTLVELRGFYERDPIAAWRLAGGPGE